jgi:ABC-type sugar transport system substrate-binding protein
MRIGLFLVQSKSVFQGRLKQAAEDAAQRLGVTLDVAFAEGDSAQQREQLFAFIRRDPKPDGFLVQPIEASGVRFVVREAHQKGLGCAFINRHPTFVDELRAQTGGVVFSVTADNVEIGRIQGEQFRALLPEGGAVLYVTGPSSADSAAQRLEGAEKSKGPLVSIMRVAANWTRQGGEQAVSDWLHTTLGMVRFDMLGAQNDDMAIGAREALGHFADRLQQPQLRTLPATGVDGLPEFGQRLVAARQLAASVIMPTTTGEALEMLVAALRGGPRPTTDVQLTVTPYPQTSALRGGMTLAPIANLV